MREIKFLAFNKEEKVLCRVTETDFKEIITVRFPEFDNDDEFGSEYNDQMMLNEFQPFMQCTGLKDKDGKEIYEGFILEDEKGNRYEVYWANDWGAWFVKDVNRFILMHKLMHQANVCKIVGHIYQ